MDTSNKQHDQDNGLSDTGDKKNNKIPQVEKGLPHEKDVPDFEKGHKSNESGYGHGRPKMERGQDQKDNDYSEREPLAEDGISHS